MRATITVHAPDCSQKNYQDISSKQCKLGSVIVRMLRTYDVSASWFAEELSGHLY
jgi:hypothetical protein